MERVFLVVTNFCTARCYLCSYPQQNPKRFLPISFIREEVVPLMVRHRTTQVIITGGEPTLHPGLPEIIRELKKVGISVTLITNGSRLAECFETIVEDVDSYIFSIDGGNQDLYYAIRGLTNFNELLEWPERIKKSHPGAQVAFSCLLQKLNVGHLEEVYRVVARLPINALFFNVPELRPRCFGRGEVVPQCSIDQVLLDEGELAMLERNIKQVRQLDEEWGLLAQGEEFFENCIRYFKGLMHRERVSFNPVERVCQVPFSSIVIDESQSLNPCFYLSHRVPFFCHRGGDPFEQEGLQGICNEIASNPEFRQKHCACCLQYQS